MTNDLANDRKLKTIHTTNFLGFNNIQSKTRVANYVKYGDNTTKNNNEYHKQCENYYARMNKELQLMATCG